MKVLSDKIAGVVVLYNPGPDVLDNIQTYAGSVEKLYIIDNSDQIPADRANQLQASIAHAEFIPLGQNLGIAKALNIAANKAIEEGYRWLLTMDQDSQASAGMVLKLLKVFTQVDPDQIGIVAPQYVQEKVPTIVANNGFQEVDVAITSGNLLNLKAYLAVGSFREDFFIDYVDYEYCLRLKSSNYKIIIQNKAILHHRLGESKDHKFFGFPLTVSHHSFIRRYYITRNRLAVLKEFKTKFPHYYKSESNKNWKELIKIILFEDDKKRKIKSFIAGYKDFLTNNFGKFRN